MRFCFSVSLCFTTLIAHVQSPFIHVDQFGYLPNLPKVAVLSNPQVGFNADLSFNPPALLELRNATTDAVVQELEVLEWNNGQTHQASGDAGWQVDFSAVQTAGSYYLHDPVNNESSAVFEIGDQVYAEVLKAAGRMFYYNRCNAAKHPEHAGSWADEEAFSNPNQDAEARYIYDQNNADLTKDLSGGWWDAGDNNKYVTFAHATVHDLLSAYQHNPEAFGDDWNIPESGNGIPDLLDEVKWELDWLLKMNNVDGSTHIKMGNKDYSDNIETPPSLNVDSRYYGPTCTSASIAAMSNFAHAALVFEEIEGMGSFVNLLEERAIACWNFLSPQINDGESFETNCDDGSINAGDADWTSNEQYDRLIAAAVFMHALTGEEVYKDYFLQNYTTLEQLSAPFWGPYANPINDALELVSQDFSYSEQVRDAILSSLSGEVSNNYNGFYGTEVNDLYPAFMPEWSYHWGSNMPMANYGTLNMLVDRLDVLPQSSSEFQAAAYNKLQYFHGINPLGLVYISNMSSYGAERSCNEIYHTWFWEGSVYDHALESPIGPAPGFVVGGPNASYSYPQDAPPFGQPNMKSYLDFNAEWPSPSYEVSEPAIYYQAAYLRLLANFVDVGGTIDLAEEEQATLKTYPNPSSGNVFFEGLPSTAHQIAVYNASGQLVLERSLQSGQETMLNLAEWGRGMYTLKVLNSKGHILLLGRQVVL